MHFIKTVTFVLDSEDAVAILLAESNWVKEISQSDYLNNERKPRYIVQFKFAEEFDTSIFESPSTNQYQCNCLGTHQSSPM